MSVTEIELAIAQLPLHEVTELADWFEEFLSELWDKQIEEDLRAGRLDALINEANEDFEAGRVKRLAQLD